MSGLPRNPPLCVTLKERIQPIKVNARLSLGHVARLEPFRYNIDDVAHLVHQEVANGLLVAVVRAPVVGIVERGNWGEGKIVALHSLPRIGRQI